MHCIVTTDGSRASLVGARQFKWIADSREITDVTVIAVVSPFAAVPFANELGQQRTTELTDLSFQQEAQAAVDKLAQIGLSGSDVRISDSSTVTSQGSASGEGKGFLESIGDFFMGDDVGERRAYAEGVRDGAGRAD